MALNGVIQIHQAIRARADHRALNHGIGVVEGDRAATGEIHRGRLDSKERFGNAACSGSSTLPWLTRIPVSTVLLHK